MSSERIFTDIHLPGGPRLATNPSNTEEENRALDELFSELADVAGERDIYYNLLKVREEEIAEANERLRAFAREMGGQGNDKHGKNRNTESMNEITREEFNAKIETIEAKMDARVESVSSKIEGFLSAQAERDKRLDGVLAQIGKDNGETKTSIGSMKTTLIVTAVSTVLAIVLGVAGFNTALTSNMLSAFQLGKSSSTPTSETVAPEPTKGSPTTSSPPAAKSGS